MGGCRVEEGAVWMCRGVDVHRYVDVGCAADVMAGEDGGELNSAVLVDLLGAAENGVVRHRRRYRRLRRRRRLRLS